MLTSSEFAEIIEFEGTFLNQPTKEDFTLQNILVPRLQH